MRRVVQYGGIAILLFMLSYPPLEYGRRIWVAMERRSATIDELSQHASFRSKLDSPEAAAERSVRFPKAASFLESEMLPRLETPRLFSAHVYATHEVDPYIEVYWLEDGHAVDGVDIYIDGALVSTLTGWSDEHCSEPELVEELFGNRYDRFRVVEFVGTEVDAELEEWQVPVDPAALNGAVEVQLRLSGPAGNRLMALCGFRTLLE